MTIYVTHSTSFDYKKELYLPIRRAELNTAYTFILPHEASNMPYETKQLFESGKCDVVLAEVSYASTGSGIELGWANVQNIPIVCISKKGSTPSGALKSVSDEFMEYQKEEDMIQKITLLLEHYTKS